MAWVLGVSGACDHISFGVAKDLFFCRVVMNLKSYCGVLYNFYNGWHDFFMSLEEDKLI